MTVTFDTSCEAIIRRNRNMMVPWFLMSSLAYYIEDDPILSDGLYDSICKQLYNEFDQIEHTHKHLLDLGSLEAGSGGHFGYDDYPSRVVHGLRHLRNTRNSNSPKLKKATKVKKAKEPVRNFNMMTC